MERDKKIQGEREKQGMRCVTMVMSRIQTHDIVSTYVCLSPLIHLDAPEYIVTGKSETKFIQQSQKNKMNHHENDQQFSPF